MGRIVLVTGVARELGRRVASALADDPATTRVIGIDVVPPRGDLGNVTFHRADLRHPVLGNLFAREGVDTVVHAAPQAYLNSRAGGAARFHELTVIGTMQLLAAGQRWDGLQHLVVASATAVYGSGARDPALLTEEMSERYTPRSGAAKDLSELEAYTRGFSRRRDDVTVTILRAADVVGPALTTGLAGFLRLPIIPRVLGHDPRLQVLHEEDLIGGLLHATTHPVPGTFNLAGDGVVVLSQAIRRLGRAGLAVPAAALGGLGALMRPAGLADLRPDHLALLTYGRVVDTSRLREELGFRPTFTTAEAITDNATAATTPSATAHRRSAGPRSASVGGSGA